MNQSAQNTNKVLRKKWFFAWFVIFSLQIVFILSFSEKNHPVSYDGKGLFSMIVPEELDLNHEFIQIQNPVLFAFPAKNNYSAKSWFKIQGLRNEYYEWAPDAFFLPLIPDTLGSGFNKFLPQLHNILDISIFEMKNEESTSSSVGLRLDNIYSNSNFKIDGELAKRQILSAPELPVIESSDVFPPSIVEVIVNSDGFVVSSTLIGSCGFPPADQIAVKLAKKFVFSKADSTGINVKTTFGKIIFYWIFKPVKQTDKR